MIQVEKPDGIINCMSGLQGKLEQTVTWKSKVSLNPQWNPIFQQENVMFICNGNKFFQDNSTKWFHNGTILSVTTSSLEIVNASINDSGVYECQDQKLNQSKPVFLEVLPEDWLLLQVSAKLVMEGEPLILRCHTWKNLNAFKVIYYKDGKALQYYYENFNISIDKTTPQDSGTYHCSGYVKKLFQVSESINITVQAKTHSWINFMTPFLLGILFAVDTTLFVSTHKQFQMLLMIKKIRKGKLPLNPKPKPDPKEK
ncbi:high affinity immunoglobulin epsilon receptor subunit alpha [Rhynchocyon petersi]